MNTESSLPFSGSSPLSRHTSFQGAEAATVRALPQTVRLLQLLHDAYPDGLTDAESAVRLGVERSSVNARRAPLVAAGLVEAYGTRERASSDLPNVIWRLRLPARKT
jgi:hypothetical protein